MHGLFAVLAVLGCWSALALAQTNAPSSDPLPPAPTLFAPIGLPVAGGDRPVFDLDQLLARAREAHPLLGVTRSEEQAARAGITTARAYPNPEIEVSPGRFTGRVPDTPSGTVASYGLAQSLENPSLREARLRGAESRVDIALAQSAATQVGLAAGIKRRFYELLRIKDELEAHNEDLQLTELILNRTQVRVGSGEAPRFDLLRAESEVAVTRKNLEFTRLRQQQAMTELRQAVGPALPALFDVTADGVAARTISDTEYPDLRRQMAERNPELAIAANELERARRQVEVERSSILPQVTLRATYERDPTMASTRIGAQISVPLFNRREGQIAEAQALADRHRYALEQRRFETEAAFEAAWRAYQAAAAQVQALDGGIIARARSVLSVAESAYRLGERGILEYLDAQRQFRLVRNELIQARFNLQLARIEIDRLAGSRLP